MIDGKPTATAFDYVEHPKILSQPDADPDTLTREALEKFLSRNDARNDDVAIGVAGQTGLARFVKLPPVEEKKIADIVKFEAKQQIPFPLDEVVWDFQKIGGGEVIDGFAMETEIGLFAMKRDMIARYLRHFKGVEVEVHIVQMAPLALFNFATYDLLKKGGPTPPAGGGGRRRRPRGKKRCVVVLDIGTDASNLIITDGGEDHLAAADPARRQPLHPRPDQGTEAHLRQGRAPEAERRQVARTWRRSSRPSSRCSPTSSARCSGRSATSPTPTATPTSRTWSAWAAPSAARPAEVPRREAVARSEEADQVRAAARATTVLDRPAVQREPAHLPGRLRAGPAGAGAGPADHQPAAQGDRPGPAHPGQEAVRGGGGGRRCWSAWAGMAMGFSAPYAAVSDKRIEDGIGETTKAASALRRAEDHVRRRNWQDRGRAEAGQDDHRRAGGAAELAAVHRGARRRAAAARPGRQPDRDRLPERHHRPVQPAATVEGRGRRRAGRDEVVPDPDAAGRAHRGGASPTSGPTTRKRWRW